MMDTTQNRQYNVSRKRAHTGYSESGGLGPGPAGGCPASPLESFLFRQVGSGDGRSGSVPLLGPVKGSEAAAWSAAWRAPISMRPLSSHAQRSSCWALQVHCGSGERRAATTRPSWPTSTGARRGDHPVADADQFDYNLHGQARRSGDHPPVDLLELGPCSSGGSRLLEPCDGQIGL